jgi:hypothetical protein
VLSGLPVGAADGVVVVEGRGVSAKLGGVEGVGIDVGVEAEAAREPLVLETLLAGVLLAAVFGSTPELDLAAKSAAPARARATTPPTRYVVVFLERGASMRVAESPVATSMPLESGRAKGV